MLSMGTSVGRDCGLSKCEPRGKWGGVCELYPAVAQLMVGGGIAWLAIRSAMPSGAIVASFILRLYDGRGREARVPVIVEAAQSVRIEVSLRGCRLTAGRGRCGTHPARRGGGARSSREGKAFPTCFKILHIRSKSYACLKSSNCG